MSQTISTSDSICTDLHAYAEGAVAFRDGKPDTANPYPPRDGKGLDRINWFDGWYDARGERKFGKLLRRYGEVWP